MTTTQIREMAEQILGRHSVASPNTRRIAKEALKLCMAIEAADRIFKTPSLPSPSAWTEMINEIGLEI